MNEESIKKLIKSIDIEVTPSKEAKERIYENIINCDLKLYSETEELSMLQRFFFIKPLRAAACLAILISSMMWGILGNSYINIFAFVGR